MLEPATAEYCLSQPPWVGLIRMGDPGADARINITCINPALPPLVPQAAKAVAETMDVVFGELPMAAHDGSAAGRASFGGQHESEERCWLRRRQDHRLAWMQLEPPASEIAFDPRSPLRQHGRVVVEQREVIDVANVGRAEHFADPVVETIEV